LRRGIVAGIRPGWDGGRSARGGAPHAEGGREDRRGRLRQEDLGLAVGGRGRSIAAGTAAAGRAAAVKRTVHHRAQERKHCTLSANKPGFVVISSCGARVEPAQHTDAHTGAPTGGHCENASAPQCTHRRGRDRQREREREGERERERERERKRG